MRAGRPRTRVAEDVHARHVLRLHHAHLRGGQRHRVALCAPQACRPWLPCCGHESSASASAARPRLQQGARPLEGRGVDVGQGDDQPAARARRSYAFLRHEPGPRQCASPAQGAAAQGTRARAQGPTHCSGSTSGRSTASAASPCSHDSRPGRMDASPPISVRSKEKLGSWVKDTCAALGRARQAGGKGGRGSRGAGQRWWRGAGRCGCRAARVEGAHTATAPGPAHPRR